jgi:HAD superfamily hydrolase (TIGR01549 family)
LDGTLCDSSQGLSAAIREVYEYSRIRHPNKLLNFDDWTNVYDRIASLEAPPFPLKAKTLRATRFEAVLQEFDIDDPRLVDELAETFGRIVIDRVELYPDVESALEELSRRNYTMGLITNGPADLQREKINRLKLNRFFDKIVVGPEHGMWKPMPLIFKLALNQLALEPKEAMYVGDSFAEDVLGARGVGLIAVLINRNVATKQTDEMNENSQVSSLIDLLRMTR